MRRKRKYHLKEVKPPIINDFFLSDKKMGITSCREWLFNDFDNLTEKFIEDNFHPDDHNNVSQYFWEEPKMARLLIIDYFRSNEEKINEVIKEFKGEKSIIALITGRRGSGKTAAAFWMAEQLKDERKIYYCGEKIEGLPKWCCSVEDVSETPRGCLIIMDEVGIQASARSFYTKQNIWLSQQLMTLRHDNKTILFMTQHTRLVDVNLTRLADCLFQKPQSSFQAITERKLSQKTYITQLITNLMPRKKKETLFQMGNRIIKFTQPLPDCWSNKISQSWKDIGKKLKAEEEKRIKEEIKKIKKQRKRSKKKPKYTI